MAVEPLGDFADRFGVGFRRRPGFRDGRDEVVAAEFGTDVEGQLQAELNDFLDVGASVALGLAGQGVQVELLRLVFSQPQVDSGDLLAFFACVGKWAP